MTCCCGRKKEEEEEGGRKQGPLSKTKEGEEDRDKKKLFLREAAAHLSQNTEK